MKDEAIGCDVTIGDVAKDVKREGHLSRTMV